MFMLFCVPSCYLHWVVYNLFCILLPFLEQYKWRASGACRRRGLYPSASGRQAGVSSNNRAVQGWHHPSSAGVRTVAHRSVRPTGGPVLWQIWYLRTLECHLAKCTQAPCYSSFSSETWLSTEQNTVYHWYPLGPGEHFLLRDQVKFNRCNPVKWFMQKSSLVNTLFNQKKQDSISWHFGSGCL